MTSWPARRRRTPFTRSAGTPRSAGAYLQQLVDDVDQAAVDAGYLGGGTVTSRGASITWTFPSTDVPARQLILAGRLAADRLNPGSWVITADDHT